MGAHDPRHRETLEAILAGELDRTAALAELGGCSTCERELFEMEIVGELLDLQAGQSELAAGSLSPFERGEAAARERLRELAALDARGAGREGGARRRARWIVSVLAAAAVVLFVVRSLLGPGPAPEPIPRADVFIGGGAIELLTPTGAPLSRAGLELTWTGELQDGDQFVIRLLDDQGQVLRPSPVRVRAARWAPSAEVVAEWPQVVRVQVAVLDFLGGEEIDHSAWTLLEFE